MSSEWEYGQTICARACRFYERPRSEAGHSLGIRGILRTRLLYLDVSGHLFDSANNLVCVHDERVHRL